MAIVHRRVQLLVGHLDRSGLFEGGSIVDWGGGGDRFRLHLVACARTRSARDGRWPSLPWGGRGCIARHQGKRTGRMQAQGERSRPRGRRPHEAEARPRRDRSRRGGQHCAVGRRHWGAVGGYCTAGEGRARKPRNTGRGEQGSSGSRTVRVAVCRLGCGVGVAVRRLGGGTGRMAAHAG